MKNIKNQKNIKHNKRFANNLIVKATLVFTVLATACASLTDGFSRGMAATAIENDKRYSEPAAMTIDIGARLPNAWASADQISDDDTAEAAAIRAKEDFMQRQPQIIVAEQLGYIKLYFEKAKLEPGKTHIDGQQDWGAWSFRPRAEITDKGRALWNNLNSGVDEKALPVARRGACDVTGINDERADTKKVDFSYKWEPTELGKAFDPNNAAFGKLPQNLQEALKKVQRNMFGGGGNNVADFNSTRQGISHFKKYDDGWRLDQLYFM